MKKCRDCNEMKDITEYHKSKANRDGHQTWCKKCQRIRMKKWEEKNPEKVRQNWEASNYLRCRKICKACGKEYIRNGKEDGCSIPCRLLIGIEKNENGCWEWKKSLNARGYGQMRVNGQTRELHKISYRAFKGPVDNGLYVLHKCDNRKCINPDHLYLGTQKDNMRDRFEKERKLKEKQNAQKITS